jgi:flagellar M-ring protein FliF
LDPLLRIWADMDPQRRILTALAVVAALALVGFVARIAMTPSMALLYGGLEGAQAGEIVAALDARGQRYEVRGNSIWVEARARDETRMTLASQGLPASSTNGYEILDGLSGFGTTSQMFDAAYWRAKEGELARTIVASPHVRAARVHIAQGSGVPFRRDRQASASVTVTPAGGPITQAQAQAFRFLVASAVPGLGPQDVAVIDTLGGLIPTEEAGAMGRTGERAEELRRNVERLLEAHLGPGRAVVEVNIDTVLDREVITERVIDPESRVAIRQENDERNATSTDNRQGGVSVASNLPDGDAAPGEGQAETRDVQTATRTTFDLSQTQREIERSPGAIRRLTVAVLIDGTRQTAADGTPTFTPRAEEEMQALRELVASAVGFDAARGDVITLHSLPFEPLAPAPGTLAGPGMIERLGIDAMAVIRLLALLIALAILVLFVLRPALREGRGRSALALPARPGALPAGPVLSGEIDDAPARLGEGQEGALRTVTTRTEAQIDPVERMRKLITERQTESLEILRGWVEDGGERR